jgi:hypothetical protein
MWRLIVSRDGKPFCEAVEWALDDEAVAAKEGENNEP